jgi:hypothetical protein
MLKRVFLDEFADLFDTAGRGNAFTPEARRALFRHLESMEAEAGNEYVLDVIQLCTDFEEFDTRETAAESQGIEPHQVDTVATFPGGFVVRRQ